MSTIQPINKLTIGLFGFGVVGKGLHEVLQNTPTLHAAIKKICIKDPYKKRSISADHFTTQAVALLDDESINVIVELIDDADAAYHIVKYALQKGKSVVSANKKMIAAHLEELIGLQHKYGSAFLYEGACCASIPIIRNLEEYYDNDLLSSVKGIVNGSTNYILTKIFEEGITFNNALLQAQQAGFAESDPSLDIEGHDAANKLSILLTHAFGILTSPADILYTGITAIKESDALIAKQKGLKIKLVASAQKINDTQLAAFVLPQFVQADDELSGVSNEYNGLLTESCFADKHFFKGKGAGAYPTAAAVLSDIAALRHNYKYEYKKYQQLKDLSLTHDFYLKVFISADKIEKIQKDSFEYIEELYTENKNCYAIGVIHASVLAETGWWKQENVSLILYPDSILSNLEYESNRKNHFSIPA